ncbi:MAG: bifunctional aldolase/short-chain dehydrogenase [gamma proteobacterium symbiont of Bathyaustriella thionipta]|nr:bifunctional aldolase/short-chain dehydrogenase [gamma proteobacterium symbiont of Bathyaustriella thionipta]MCU7950219.1 bifunctional aldolase/short-chain dehydrogenase [gamma proteobacterium symbiont of Bathyaustriella thionipta]MCU7952084.1 bifunctional aldolase/short-chain dehydrogenase [gamma proteobacterium symbiont of Bathyaustriella thionipta]MCU7956754.1 bifunctional aldolase/short-chain dehydrogenase [gamma proteobacterium symbiont of Bathyaustriella thionipta]MCU7965975.1 bifuncti
MQNRWNENDAQQYSSGNNNPDLALRVYSSRLLGQDKSLVLHGGGNTSVKIEQTNILGDRETILYVKGSGWDLETIEAQGYAPVQMSHLLKLAQLKELTDAQMVNELKTHLTLSNAPGPSVETILHALLPYKYVDHTHADAVVSITNTENGMERIKALYGNKVVIIPYVMPGFDLARLCAEIFPAEAHSETIGMVLMNHGIFSFGEDAKQSYDRMIELVAMAENYLQQQQALDVAVSYADTSLDTDDLDFLHIAQFRQELSQHFKQPLVVHQHRDAQTLAFANHTQLDEISQKGPATPDHVIRTKQLPMLGTTSDLNLSSRLNAYIESYQAYFKQGALTPHDGQKKNMLDPLPRIILDAKGGMLTLGKSIKEAHIIRDIYQHTIGIILRATRLGGFQALPSHAIFDVEYWELEQAKLKKAGTSPLFSGEVALVTGAVTGIGKACVDSLLARGACVVAVDILPEIETLYQRPDYLGITCDVTDEQALEQVLEQTIRQFGGLDMLILNAGIFPGGCRIEALPLAEWRQVMTINLDANLSLLSKAHPLLKLAPNGGRIVAMGSKNVPAPGPGAAAYSSAKAALNQLARVAALEWGKDNIRINTLHPNAVFDTAIWTPEVLASRAEHYGMSIEAYKTNNLLHTEITSHDVAELAAEMCGPLFAKTTAAQLPVDGGNDRVV